MKFFNFLPQKHKEHFFSVRKPRTNNPLYAVFQKTAENAASNKILEKKKRSIHKGT